MSDLEPVVIDIPEPTPAIDEGIGGEEAIEEMEEDVSDAGPEMLWLVLFSAIAGMFYSNARSKKTSM